MESAQCQNILICTNPYSTKIVNGKYGGVYKGYPSKYAKNTSLWGKQQLSYDLERYVGNRRIKAENVPSFDVEFTASHEFHGAASTPMGSAMPITLAVDNA